jgi:TetR/AcrR family transcriptional regulator, fatty acid biosynthesis regulator
MAAPRPLSREEQKLITRRRLLEAAAKLLSESGYAGLTTASIAREAGVAQPTFYVHFKDKDDLVRTLAREKMEALRRPLRELRQQVARERGLEALHETFRLPLMHLLEQPELFRLFVQEYHQPGSPFGAEARALQRELEADLVEDLRAAGLFPDDPAERERLNMMAEGMIALTQTLALGYLDGRYHDAEKIVDVLTDFALGVLVHRETMH